jgi:hypothetical protein
VEFSEVFSSSELYRGVAAPIKDFPLPRDG